LKERPASLHQGLSELQSQADRRRTRSAGIAGTQKKAEVRPDTRKVSVFQNRQFGDSPSGYYFCDDANERRLKPDGVHGVEIRWDFSDVPVVNPESLIRFGFDTASPYTVEFAGEDRGRTVYLLKEKSEWLTIGDYTPALTPNVLRNTAKKPSHQTSQIYI
jgi:hypothetical protein